MLAQKSGTFDIKLQYQLPVTKSDAESSIVLPVPFGLVNRLNLTLVNLDVDVLSPQAVSIQRDTVGQQHRRHAGPLAGERRADRLEAAQPRRAAREAGLLRGDFPALRARRRA